MLKKFLISAVLVFLFLYLITTNISSPFTKHNDWENPLLGHIARNYIKYGYVKTKCGMVMSSGLPEDTPSDKLVYYTHHPPLLPIIISLYYRLAGISEITTRLVSVYFVIATIILLYLLVLKIFKSESIAVLATIFFAFMPMTIFFGRRTTFEPVESFFVLSILYSYWNWAFEGKKSFGIMLIIFQLALLLDWPSYYLGILIPLHYLISKRFNGADASKKIWILPSLCICTFLLFLAHIYLLKGADSVKELFQTLAVRTTIIEGDNRVTATSFLKKTFSDINNGFTSIILLLALFWLSNFIYGIFSRTLIEIKKHLLIFILYCFSILYVLQHIVGPEHYLVYYLSIPLAISSSISLANLAGLSNILNINIQKVKANYFIIIIIILQFLISALGRVNGFYQWNDAEKYYNLSQFIRTANDKHGVILPFEYRGGYPYIPFLEFYNDIRFYYWGNLSSEDVINRIEKNTLPPDATYIVLDVSKTSYLCTYLKARCQFNEYKGWLIFKLIR